MKMYPCAKKIAPAACLLLVACACAIAEQDEPEPLAVTAAWLGDSSGAGGAAIAALLAGVLSDSGVPARAVPPSPACRPLADVPTCLSATLTALAVGELAVALLPVPAATAPPAWRLRDAGLEDLGDAAPLARRTCVALPDVTSNLIRSMLDLADPNRAAAAAPDFRTPVFENTTYEPQRCHNNSLRCASITTSDEGEKSVLIGEVERHRLYATVTAAGDVRSRHQELRRGITCDWALELSEPALQGELLGPPPCVSSEPCPFETIRIVKYVNVHAVVRTSRALSAIVRLTFTSAELREMLDVARSQGASTAALSFLAEHRLRARQAEVRVAVLLPNSTRRETFNAPALAAAAMAAEDSLERERIPRRASFKVEIYDDGCSATKAYKYMLDALGTGEYGSLSALLGPGCGAAFVDVVRQSPAHSLPVLAYSAQTPPADSPLTLLAAGDARERVSALGALIQRMGWRRLVALSEPATHALLDPTRLRANLVVHVEVPRDTDSYGTFDLVRQWAERAVAEDGRIVYACVEDARLLRAALCAAHRAGLAPAAGAVWLLPVRVADHALQPAPNDPGNCTRADLQHLLEGHFSVEAEWERAWINNRSTAAQQWRQQWREYYRRAGGNDAAEAPSHAALLYDALRLWAAALDRVLMDSPAAVDDLHDQNLIRKLVRIATSVGFEGLTGRFNWSSDGEALARVSSLTVLQWAAGESRAVARWKSGELALREAALRWTNAGGRAPPDGSERCAVRALATALGGDCRVAYALLALGTLLMAGAALLAGTLYCKRRVERQYRERLTALGLRELPAKALGLDRWELPRERVVINRKIGTGAFGTVYGGHALLAEDRGWTAVAVKTLKPGASTEEKLDFLSEAEAMKRFDHKNVVRLLGVVTKTEPVCTVMEFMLYGDLKNYLLARRHLASSGCVEDAADEVSARPLTGMALDAARALSYLAQLRYVHRDVAARNCLVSSGRVIKLADFGMSRLVFENDYYRFSRKGMLPVRWMAPESLALGVFSTASDVWSFGVLLYEIITFGSLPFQGMTNSEVLAYVKAGNTIELPSGVKPRLEGLIKSCWQQESKVRPGAAEIAAFLADSPRLLAPCLDVPLDVLPLAPPLSPLSPLSRPRTRLPPPVRSASAATDTTDLSDEPAPAETEAFLPSSLSVQALDIM